MALPVNEALMLFYSQFIPRGLELPFILLLLYGIYILIASGVLLLALKIAGAKINYQIDFPRSVITIVLRDFLTIPFLVLVLFAPIFGVIIAFIIWLGILKYMFQISWYQAFLVWLASGIIHLVLILLVIVPVILLL